MLFLLFAALLTFRSWRIDLEESCLCNSHKSADSTSVGAAGLAHLFPFLLILLLEACQKVSL